jgi:hypothetical protein
MVFDSRQASTARETQSMIATRYRRSASKAIFAFRPHRSSVSASSSSAPSTTTEPTPFQSSRRS